MRIVSGSMAVVVFLAACGGSGGSGGGGPSGPTGPAGPSGATSATVLMEKYSDIYGDDSFRFSPSAVSVARSGTVTWSNGSGEAHNVTFAATTGAPTNISDHSGGSNARTFSTAGTFNYSCTLHAGMTGQVLVQ